MEQTNTRLPLEAFDRANAQGWPARFGFDQGLWQFAAAQIQKARVEELQQHFPAVADAAFVQHTAQCARAGAQGFVCDVRHGQGLQVFSKGPQDGAHSNGHGRRGHYGSDRHP